MGNGFTDIEVLVYKSDKKPDYYLYVTVEDDLSKVPDALIEQFGELVQAIRFVLHEDRTLAREGPATVRRNLREQGYHLQLPPPGDRFL